MRFLLGLMMALLAGHPLAQAAPMAQVAIFAGQSNQRSEGTHVATYGYAGVPGAAGSAGVNAAAMCYETPQTLQGATPGSGTLICQAPSNLTIYAGQAVSGAGTPAGQVVTAANNGGNFPAATGAGVNGGAYVVTPAASVGSASAPVAMSFSEPDIGGSGVPVPGCMIWAPNHGQGGWQKYLPNVNSDFNGVAQGQQGFGPEGEFCREWVSANPGSTLYMIKLAVGGASLCPRTSGNNYSPESGPVVGGTAAFNLLAATVRNAEQALSAAGIAYSVKIVLWGQGEEDSLQNLCNFPNRPFAATTTPVPYLENLKDLASRLAVPNDIDAQFTGAISGNVLTVTSAASGRLARYQLLTGSGVLPSTYVGAQLSGAAGGVGTYQLNTYQATDFEVISGSNGASCSRGAVRGQFFFAAPLTYTATKVLTSCVTGSFSVGVGLSGAKVLAGTTIASLDSKGDTGAGLYVVRVDQTTPSEPMSAHVPGFGVGADTARFVAFRTFSNAGTALPNGVQIAQAYVNDHAVLATPAAVVNTNDALKALPGNVHYHATWIAELGRRLFAAYAGKCDYHSPTC